MTRLAAGSTCAVAVAVGAWALYGPGVLGYDAVWALRWADGASYEAAFAPTPHPLANLVAVLLSPLGPDGATTVTLALSWLSLGVLAVALAWLGAALFSWPVGIFAAAVVVTRLQLAAETAQALVDVPFLALVMSAAVVELRRPRQGIAVGVLLLLAGLLRPEAWALAAAYALYRRDRHAVVALAAPVAWALSDLLITGDLLHSLHGTQALGEALGRPTGSRTALSVAPDALRDIVQTPMLWVALAGAAAGIVYRDRASALPAAVAAGGLAGFMVLGAFGLPVLARYLLLPAVMLMLFAGLAVFGWTTPGAARLWQLGGAIAAVVVLVGVPQDIDDLREINRFTALRHAIQDDLRDAVRATEDHDCRRLLAPDHRALAVVRLQREPGASGALYFTPTDPRVQAGYAIGRAGPPVPPLGAREVHTGRFWRVSARGC